MSAVPQGPASPGALPGVGVRQPAGGPLAARVAGEQAAAARLARLGAAAGVGAGTAAAAAGAVAALGDGRWLVLPAPAPALAWLALGAGGAAAAVLAERRVRRATDRDAAVRHVEAERALRAGALRVALEVGGAGGLGALAAAQLARALPTGGAALAPAWRGGLARRAALAGTALAVAGVVLVASATRWPDGAAAFVHPVDAARGTLLPALHFAGAPARVARGRPLRLALDAPGRKRVEVAWRVAGRPWAARALVPDARGRAGLAIDALDADLVAVATDGRARTDTLRVAADDRPFVGGVRLRAEYPAYLGMPAAEVPLGDTVRVPRGTVLALTARASAALAEVALGGVDAPVAAQADSSGATALGVRWAPAGDWRGGVRHAWRAVARGGGAVDVPEPFVVVAVPDAPPVAAAALRGAGYDGATPVVLAVTAGDDHGLAAVRVHAVRRRADGGEVAGGTTASVLGSAAGAASWNGTVTVDPARLGAGPGEAVVVRVEAVDASPWAQRGWSAPLVLAAPTVDAQRTAARSTADSAQAAVSAALAAARDLQQRTADAARSRALATSGTGPNGSTPNANAANDRALPYEAAERARALAAQQRQLAGAVEAARAQTEALERRMRQAGALDTALARQLADARRMLRDALTPELAAKLAALEQPGGAVGAAQTRETLEQLADAQRALKERLERTADLLRRAALEGAMQTLGDEARDVAAAEARAAQRPQPNGSPNADPKAPNGQSGAPESPARTAARAAAVRDAIDSLRARLGREQAQAGAKGAAEANAHAARSAQAMQRAAAQAGASPAGTRRAGAPQGGAQQNGAQQGGEQGMQQSAASAAGEMRAAADALQRGRSAQIDAWKSALGAELDRAASETAQLAREQAAVRDAARAGNDPAGTRGAQAAVREGVEQTARRLEQAGRTSALLSERTRRAMDEARQQVAAAGRALERSGGAPGAGSPSSGSPNALSPNVPSPNGMPSGGGARGGARGGAGGGAGGGSSPDAAMAQASEALDRVASALVRDRARVRESSSAAGAEDALAQFRAAAGQQARLNAQSLTLPQPGTQGGGREGAGREGAGREGARRLAEQQRAVADRLDQLGDADGSGRGEELAREARALAGALDRQAAGGARNDPATLARQQQLYRKLLEAGQSLERDEQDDKGPRQARAGIAVGDGAPADGPNRGRAAARVAPPTWGELRALSPEERRLVLEYFRRVNAAP